MINLIGRASSMGQSLISCMHQLSDWYSVLIAESADTICVAQWYNEGCQTITGLDYTDYALVNPFEDLAGSVG